MLADFLEELRLINEFYHHCPFIKRVEIKFDCQFSFLDGIEKLKMNVHKLSYWLEDAVSSFLTHHDILKIKRAPVVLTINFVYDDKLKKAVIFYVIKKRVYFLVEIDHHQNNKALMVDVTNEEIEQMSNYFTTFTKVKAKFSKKNGS